MDDDYVCSLIFLTWLSTFFIFLLMMEAILLESISSLPSAIPDSTSKTLNTWKFKKPHPILIQGKPSQSLVKYPKTAVVKLRD